MPYSKELCGCLTDIIDLGIVFTNFARPSLIGMNSVGRDSSSQLSVVCMIAGNRLIRYTTQISSRLLTGNEGGSTVQAGRCMVGYVQDDMYPLLKRGGHYAHVGVPRSFLLVLFCFFWLGVRGPMFFFCISSRFHSLHRILVGFRCRAPVLFGGLLLGRGCSYGGDKEKVLFECLCFLVLGFDFFIIFGRGSYWVWSGRGRPGETGLLVVIMSTLQSITLLVDS